MPFVRVIGAGLAGCEAALTLARLGFKVELFEMKPKKKTAAQTSDGFCELVCSNSFRSTKSTNAVALLKDEMLLLDGVLMGLAQKARVPAGDSLSVDRVLFSKLVEEAIHKSTIKVINEEVRRLPLDATPTILATGPLTSDELAQDLTRFIGSDRLAFYDAIAPIIEASSVDMSCAFLKSRWQEDGSDGDYLNCPLDQKTYGEFVNKLLSSDRCIPHDFEDVRYFEGCLPIEVMAERGFDTLRYGPFKPVGLRHPVTNEHFFAVLQLRKEDCYGTSYNLVGCQTRMKIDDQKQAFSLIPALRNAQFMRFGSIHRNTYVNAPLVLDEQLRLKSSQGESSHIYLAGQITGVEGYVESMAVGLIVAHIVANTLLKQPIKVMPKESTLGGLYGHILGHHRVRPTDPYTPSNITWAMIPPLLQGNSKNAQLRKLALYERAINSIKEYRHGLFLSSKDAVTISV